jgi:translation initiation factor 1A
MADMKSKFKDKSKKNKGFVREQPVFQEVTRARIPRENEVIGVVEQRVGANRMIVKCFDEKVRNCRIPGSLRRSLWIRPGDTVIVESWEFDKDCRGDIVFKYTPAAIEWLRRKGFIKDIGNEF